MPPRAKGKKPAKKTVPKPSPVDDDDDSSLVNQGYETPSGSPMYVYLPCFPDQVVFIVI